MKNLNEHPKTIFYLDKAMWLEFSDSEINYRQINSGRNSYMILTRYAWMIRDDILSVVGEGIAVFLRDEPFQEMFIDPSI